MFHNDKSPSMKVDRRYYCFGCGCTGDAIDFTAQLFGIGLKDAAMKLADDFGISYSGRDRGSPKNRRSIPIKKPEPTPEEIWQKKYLRCLRAYLDYRSLLLEWKEKYAPETWTEEWHEKFMTALRELTVVEYYLDILLFGDRADKEALVREKWKEVERIEQCEREDKGDRHKRTERCYEGNAPDGR
ncbi:MULTISPECIES: CHC2 zinc finger domain-containing protein [unclassified Candidatus Paralachnospira]|uniref:CHC2 zinc finger domain-containing protein n=1 Tax=unclassified Candidatus Paralachnospira TaxID=3099471 RepID=UPI003F92473A